MSDFLTRLVARALDLAPTAKPRAPSRFEPIQKTPMDGVRRVENPVSRVPVDETVPNGPSADIRGGTAVGLAPPAPPAGVQNLPTSPRFFRDELKRPAEPATHTAYEAPSQAFAGIVSMATADPPMAGPTLYPHGAGRGSLDRGAADIDRAAFTSRATVTLDTRTIAKADGNPARSPAIPANASPFRGGDFLHLKAGLSEDPPHSGHSAPIIRVTIGRIEVRAVTNPRPPRPAGESRQRRPAMSLEDYLRSRRERR
jgi:hypothetical protein